MQPTDEPDFTLGIEEEYLLVNRETRALVIDPPASLIEECQAHVGGMVTAELLRSQVEVGTRICTTVKDARADLARLRRGVIEVSARYGLAPIAASTHPFSRWSEQKHTRKDRYDNLMRELQVAARRAVICGMHVHVGIADAELRIDLMQQFTYFLPHLLALTCSSPFWGGHETGFKSYRLMLFDNLPRTGLPEPFRSYADYQRHVDMLVRCGVIEDGTKIWWDLRPSSRYPTLETRITDVCTRIDDAIAVAALQVALLRMLYRLRVANQRWRQYNLMLVRENRWRAMRYGMDEGLVDIGAGRVVPFAQLLEEMFELVAEDAVALDCQAELEHLRSVVAHGSSSHCQLATWKQALAEGADNAEAMRRVVDLLIEDTAAGTHAAG